MRSTLIRTGVIASLLTALVVSAVAYYAMPHSSVQADNQGVTLQPSTAAISSPSQATTTRPALVRRSGYSGYSAPPSNTRVASNTYGEPVAHRQRSTAKSAVIVAGSAGAGAAIGA